jgi:hypothetical protein
VDGGTDQLADGSVEALGNLPVVIVHGGLLWW